MLCLVRLLPLFRLGLRSSTLPFYQKMKTGRSEPLEEDVNIVFNSLLYRKYSAQITEQLVKHYCSEEAIVAWQVDNEFGHEGSDMCYCEQCHKEFQQFLERKYKDINELNEKYGTIFWGQTYNEFTEVPMPVKTITTHSPSLKLDWARFRSFSCKQIRSRTNGDCEEI